MTIPAGWQLHPNDPRWIYEIANPANMVPTPAGAPAPDPLAGQLGGQPTYGTLDVDEAVKQQKLFRGFSGDLYIDFPDFDASGWSVLKLRLLPPWSMTNRRGFVQIARHRVFAEHYPQDVRGNRQVIYETCLNMEAGEVKGPGECPFCETHRDSIKAGLSDDATKHLANYKVSVGNVWQAIDMTTEERLHKHFVQAKKEDGSLQLDAAGQPVWNVIPGRFRMGNQLLGDVQAIMKTAGDPTHPDFGYAISMLKQKTGTGQFDVKYKANMTGSKEAIPAVLRPVLANLINLEAEEIQFSDRGMLCKVADSVRAKVGLPLKWTTEAPAATGAIGGGSWMTHPDNPAWEFHTVTRALREKGKVA